MYLFTFMPLFLFPSPWCLFPLFYLGNRIRLFYFLVLVLHFSKWSTHPRSKPKATPPRQQEKKNTSHPFPGTAGTARLAPLTLSLDSGARGELGVGSLSLCSPTQSAMSGDQRCPFQFRSGDPAQIPRPDQTSFPTFPF